MMAGNSEKLSEGNEKSLALIGRFVILVKNFSSSRPTGQLFFPQMGLVSWKDLFWRQVKESVHLLGLVTGYRCCYSVCQLEKCDGQQDAWQGAGQRREKINVQLAQPPKALPSHLDL